MRPALLFGLRFENGCPGYQYCGVWRAHERVEAEKTRAGRGRQRDHTRKGVDTMPTFEASALHPPISSVNLFHPYLSDSHWVYLSHRGALRSANSQNP